MREKNFLIVLSVMIITIISGLNLPNVLAYTQTAIPQDTIGYYASVYTGLSVDRVSPPQYRMIKHSSGKTVLLVYDSTDSYQFHIHVISATGSILCNSDTGLTGVDASIIEYDSDEIVIFYGYVSETDIKAVRFNIVSFTLGTVYSYTITGSSGAEGTRRLSYPVYNPSTSRFYVFCQASSYSAGAKTAFVYFTGSALSGTTYTMGNGVSAFRPMLYLDVTAQKIYTLFDYATSTVSLYEYDISGATLTSIATAPYSNTFPSSGAYSASYGQYITNMGVGVYVDGTEIYLYYAWCFSDRLGVWGGSPVAGTRFAETVFYYTHYNNTISSASLLDNIMIYDVDYDASCFI